MSKTTANSKFPADQPPTMGATSIIESTGGFVPQRLTHRELQDIPNIFELERISTNACLAPSLQAFLNFGAEDEESLSANREGFSRYALRPRILKNVSQVNTFTTMLGGRVQLSLPLCIAPFAGCRAMHPDGELAIAKAAKKAEIGYTVANWAGTSSVQDIVEANQKAVPLFFQIYPHKPVNENEGCHRSHMTALLKYLSSLDCIVGVILTCDTVNNGNREKTYKNAVGYSG